MKNIFKRKKPTDMPLSLANELLGGTSTYVYKTHDGKYSWRATMSEGNNFDTVNDSFNAARLYLEKGGY